MVGDTHELKLRVQIVVKEMMDQRNQGNWEQQDIIK